MAAKHKKHKVQTTRPMILASFYPMPFYASHAHTPGGPGCAGGYNGPPCLTGEPTVNSTPPGGVSQ